MSIRRKAWGHGQLEDDYRRQLLLRARKGDSETASAINGKIRNAGLLQQRTIKHAELP